MTDKGHTLVALLEEVEVSYTPNQVMTEDNAMPDANKIPLSQLPLLASMVMGILDNTEEQYQTLLEVQDKPHVLDDATVNRAQRLYRAQIEDVALYEEQARIWLKEDLLPSQREQIDTMLEQIPRIRDLSEKILVLLSEIAKGTIDRIMAMSDEELGRDYVRRNQKKHKKKTPHMQKRKKVVRARVRQTTPTDKHHEIARKIHEWVMDIHHRGGGQEEMLTNMIDYMPSFKQVMDGASSEQMDALCEQYAGFYQFGLLLQDLAGAIRDGYIDVPDDDA